MIRKSTMADQPRIVEMGLRFYAESKYWEHIARNPQQIEQLAATIIESGICLVAVDGVKVYGMLCAFLFPHPISAELIAAEMAWWVEPEYRGGTAAIKLLKAAQVEAQQRGAKRFQMIGPSDEVCQIYERLGFSYVESAYEVVL